jgi:regulatory protein YycI of two-component signal transduction system YycFG
LEPKKEIKTNLSSAVSLCRPGELNNPDMSIKCSKQNITKDHPRLVESHQIRGDFTSLSDLLEPKKQTKTSLNPAMHLCRPGELNNPDMSIKYSKQNITKDHPRLVEPHQIRGDFTSLSD